MEWLEEMVYADPNRWVWWYRPTETPQKGLYSASVPGRLEGDGLTVHGTIAFFRKFGRVMFEGKAVLDCHADGAGAIQFAPGALINCPRCMSVDAPIAIDREVVAQQNLDPQPPVLN